MTLRPVWRPLRYLGLGLILTAFSGWAQSVSEPHQKAAAAYAKLPLGFEENQGQFPASAQFVGRNPGFTLLLTQNEAWMTVDGAAASLRFAGSSSAVTPAGIELLTSVSNYLTGSDPSKWRTGVRQYGKVVYPEIYPGIDAVYYGDGRSLEFDFNVHPEAEPQTIRLAYDGVTALRLTDGGDVAFSLGGREILQRKPRAYQLEPGGSRVPVFVTYRIIAGVKEVALEVGAYDRSRFLVIDPVLEYGTFFGGSGLDGANALAVDSSGNAYITGYTQSTNLPTSPTRPFQGAFQGGSGDAFVAKINAAGSALVYTTYLGGTGDDQGTGIAIDGSGNAYVSGLTSSTNFPVLVAGQGNNLSTSYQGGASDGFVSALNASGSGLIFSGYLGGPGEDVANSLTIDANANIYVTGYSNSTRITGITSTSSQPSNAGGYDAFVTKLNKSGLILFCTFFGGSGDDYSYDIALDSSGNAYIAGGTKSPILPLSSTSRQGIQDAFMAKFAAATGALLSVLDFGGSVIQYANGITLDSSNLIYLTGTTNSINFPTVNPYQATNGGGYDAFLVQLTPVNSNSSSCHCTITLSTYLGGSDADIGYAVVVTGNGSITIAGYTDSNNFLPSLPAQPSPGQNTFVVQFLAGARTLGGIGPVAFSPVFSAYFGAFCPGNQVSLALQPATSQIFIAGYANAAFVFPSSATPPVFPYAGGASDAFIAKLAQANLGISIGTIGPYVGFSAPGSGQVVSGTAALIPITISNSGPDTAAYVTATLQLPPGVTLVECQDASVSPISAIALLSQASSAVVTNALATCSASGSTVTITAPSLPAGSMLTVQVVTNTAASLKSTTQPLSAYVESLTPNSNASNNSTSGVVVFSSVEQAFTVMPASIDFKSVYVNQSSPSQTVTLTATAPNQAVTFMLIPPSTPFFLSAPNGNLNPTVQNNPLQISVQFQPTATGMENGLLQVSGTPTNTGNPQNVFVPLAGQGVTPPNITTEEILSQLAFGGGWYTALYFTNLSTTQMQQFSVNFVGNDGSALNVPALGGSSVQVNLMPRGTAKLEAPNAGSLTQGYVLAALPSDVTGYGVFRQSVSGTPDQEAVVPLSGATATTSTLVFDDTNYTTGVAVVNLSPVPNTITATAYGPNGQAIGLPATITPELNGNGKTQSSLRGIAGLSGIAGMLGSVDFTAQNGGYVASLGLRFNGSAFTSIPAIPTPPSPVPGGTEILSQLAFGGGWYTALYFTNLSTTQMQQFSVNFVGNDGLALNVPALGGSSVQVNLMPRGTAIVQVPNAGPLTQGYVLAALPSGVTGYGVFRQSVSGIPDQEAVVPLSDTTATTSTLIFDDTNYITAVAVVNLSPMPNTITATAYGPDGQAIGLPVTITPELNGNGKTQFRLRDIISGIAGTLGSVDFTAQNGGNVASLGLRFNGSAFTSIPASNR